jgi:hypothetical protein
LSWRDLSPAEARAHPRYGIAGWLYLFFGLVLFALMADAIEWIQHGEGSDRPRWLILASVVTHLAILAAGFTKWRWFPELAIAGIWITGGLGQLFTEHARMAREVEGAIDPRQVGLVAFVAFSLILTWALLASERVNVTYKGKARRAAEG